MGTVLEKRGRSAPAHRRRVQIHLLSSVCALFASLSFCSFVRVGALGFQDCRNSCSTLFTVRWSLTTSQTSLTAFAPTNNSTPRKLRIPTDVELPHDCVRSPGHLWRQIFWCSCKFYRDPPRNPVHPLGVDVVLMCWSKIYVIRRNKSPWHPHHGFEQHRVLAVLAGHSLDGSSLHTALQASR